MADLIAYQDGNWTGATTWKGVATGTGAKQATITNSTNTTTSDVASSNFTIGNNTVCEGLLLHCNRLTTTGTVTVGLYLGTTLQREVVVNASDLPVAQSWVFFKFATTITAGTGSTYNVRVRGSSANNAAFFRNATAGNWARYIRNDTTATAAATDVTFICDELTGAGTKADITVTMNSTASTAYGECNIGQGGVLSYGTVASTNYILDLAGNMNIWGGGTLNIGTSGTPIPSTSTALLEFTMGSNVLYGMEARAGSTVNLYGATKTTTQTLLTSDAAAGQAVVNVVSTSGWAAGDLVALPSTTRDRAQGEKGTISTVNSGTQITLTGNLANLHHGTSPFEGEVMNLTRNVKIRGTSQSLCAYINAANTASITAQYVEFYWLGSATSNKYGIELATTTGSASFTFCSFYDFSSTTNFRAFNIVGSATATFIINDNSFFLPSGYSVFFQISTGNHEFKRNYVSHNATSSAFNNFSFAGIATDNRFVGTNTGNIGTSISDFSNNVVRASGQGPTLLISSLSGCKFVRNAAEGVTINTISIVVTSCTFADNASSNLVASTGNQGATFLSCTFDGGTGGSGAAQTSNHLSLPRVVGFVFDSCSFSQTSNPTTFALLDATAVGLTDCLFRNCLMPGTVTLTNQSNMTGSAIKNSSLNFDKYNSTSGNHKSFKRYGSTESDQTTFRTAAPSEALLPNNASNKLPSGSKFFGVLSGTTATVTVYVYKSGTYNGNQPRLIVRANSVAGISSDTVLATASGGTGSWLTLTGTTATVADDCVLEVFVDCDGTAGTVYVDDWSVT